MIQLTFIATAHNESRHDSPFIESILNQKDTSWKAVIFHNGPNQSIKEWIESYNDSRLSYYESSNDTGQWGTRNRQQAISFIVDTPYLINTSIQDYWLPCAVQDINKELQDNPSLVTWQAINHLFNYHILNGELAWGHIDWGQWAIRTDIIRQTGIVGGDKFSADWLTLDNIIKRGLIKSHKKVNKILTIHN